MSASILYRTAVSDPFLADELMGDVMDFTLQAGQTIMTWDPLRKVLPPPPPEGPGRLRIGPDWTAVAGNWFTKWERTVGAPNIVDLFRRN